MARTNGLERRPSGRRNLSRQQRAELPQIATESIGYAPWAPENAPSSQAPLVDRLAKNAVLRGGAGHARSSEYV